MGSGIVIVLLLPWSIRGLIQECRQIDQAVREMELDAQDDRDPR